MAPKLVPGASEALPSVQLMACLDAGTSFSGFYSSLSTAKRVAPGTYPNEPQGFNYCKQPSALLYRKLCKQPQDAADYEFLGTGHCVDLQLDQVRAAERDSYVVNSHPKLLLAEPRPAHAVLPPGLIPQHVITDWLRGLRSSAMECFQQVWGSYPGWDQASVRWMFTVPAIWSDKSMAIMRSAAHEAGYIQAHDSPLLSFCHEPEAAAVAVASELKVNLFHAGDKVLVIDAGAGTVDFALHEVERDEELWRLHQVAACDAITTGGSYVDMNFERLACTELGLTVAEWDNWRAAYRRRHRGFMNSWSTAKQKFGQDGKVTTVAVPVDRSLAKLLSEDKAAAGGGRR